MILPEEKERFMKRRCQHIVITLILVFSFFLGMQYLSAQILLPETKSLKTPTKVQVKKLASSLEKENTILSDFVYTRPVLLSPSLAEKAAGNYMKALEAFGPVLNEEIVKDLRISFDNREPLPVKTCQDIDAGLAEVMKLLRRAARCRDGTSPLAFGSRSIDNFKSSPALRAMQLSRVYYFLGIREIGSGKPEDAAEYILLSQFMLQDMARGAPILEHAVNAAHTPYFLHGMEELLAAVTDPAQLRTLDEKLQVLQENVFPYSLALEIEKNFAEPLFAVIIYHSEWKARFPFSAGEKLPGSPFDYEIPEKAEIEKLWYGYHTLMERNIAIVEGESWNDIPEKLSIHMYGKDGKAPAAVFPDKLQLLIDINLDKHWCAYAMHPAALFIARVAVQVKIYMAEKKNVTLDTMGELPYDEAVREQAALPFSTKEHAWGWQPSSTPLGEVEILQDGKGYKISLPMPEDCRETNINVPEKLTITVSNGH